MKRRRLMSDAQLEEIRSKVLFTVMNSGPSTFNELLPRCAEFATEHYLRTSLVELIDAGRVDASIDVSPIHGRRRLYSFRPYREGRSF